MSSYNSERSSSSGGRGTGLGAGEESLQDPSAGALFNVNYKKHEDLKNMLDQNKDSLKLEAMKRIIGMIARGKNASMLFPAVVKNVACKNIEVKKLVYVYLERYAEEQQDLALLSISTFQRGLKDSNQMIRASALRVLSSIRVSIIVPIMLLAIKEGVSDMCPFVRKTAAHAIPKLYSLDPEQKDNLIEIIDKILADRTTLVAGSVVMAFEHVCPDRVDLIHRHFRKLCSLLVDVDEWGQIAIISMLTRYARTQFLNPNVNENAEIEDEDKPFYDDDSEEDAEDDDEESGDKLKAPKYVMDPDHRLLLKSTRSLLQSRNAAVVMAVAQLYYHVAPKSEFHVVVKGLIRLLRGRREVQFVVLQNIASISLKRRSVFGQYMKSFYIRSTDPSHVRELKLEVLTNLATESNIAVILREFQTYVRSSDKTFVAHTIQAIARCATNIKEVTDTCLSGLVNLLSNRDESVVAESVVVIKKLLQMNPEQHKDIIKHTAKILDQIQIPMARASILWLIGEYCEIVPKIAPDVLRKEAKQFVSQEEIVKLQIINLAAKLYLTNPKQTKLISQYVLQLAKYDQNYDIRDRSRFIRHLIMPSAASADSEVGNLRKYAKRILLAPKPAPVLESSFAGRDKYQLGSLSHAINTEVNGYQQLPDFPVVQPDTSVRNVEVPKRAEEVKTPVYGRKSASSKKSKKSNAFYSDESEEEESEEDEEESGEEESSEEDEASEEESSEEESSDEEEDSSDTEGPDSRISESDVGVTSPKQQLSISHTSEQEEEEEEEESSEEESSEEEESSSEEESSEEESSEEEEVVVVKKKTKKQKKTKAPEVNLLDLDDLMGPPQPAVKGGANLAAPPPAMILTPTISSDLMGLSFSGASGDANSTSSMSPTSINNKANQQQYPLLHRVTGEGLEASYRFSREAYAKQEKMISIEIELTNHATNPIRNICVGEKKLQGGLVVEDFDEIECLESGVTVTRVLGVDFCDTTQSLQFELITKTRKFNVSVKPPIGELISQWPVPQTEFLKNKSSLSGMNENKCSIKIPAEYCSMNKIADCVYELMNVCRVPSTEQNIHRFSGKTASTARPLLVTIEITSQESGEGHLMVNCDKMVICSMIFKQLKDKLASL